eukprot:3631400-Prymnesium_polylepis.1
MPAHHTLFIDALVFRQHKPWSDDGAAACARVGHQREVQEAIAHTCCYLGPLCDGDPNSNNPRHIERPEHRVLLRLAKVVDRYHIVTMLNRISAVREAGKLCTNPAGAHWADEAHCGART